MIVVPIPLPSSRSLRGTTVPPRPRSLAPAKRAYRELVADLTVALFAQRVSALSACFAN
jgi:hypothetical protein